MARTKDTTGAAVLPIDDGEPDSKSALTRRRILDAAAQVLSVKGYGGLRLTDVAAVAEIQAPAIYYYFPGREDLIVAGTLILAECLDQFGFSECLVSDTGLREGVLIDRWQKSR